MALQLTCPCGVRIAAPEDDFVGEVNAHLADEHGRTYGPDQITVMAMTVPDPVAGGA